MTALTEITLYCDWPDCKEAFSTTEHSADEARGTADMHGWLHYYGLDLCVIHKANHAH